VTGGRFEVILERRARKSLAALDPPVRRRVAACIDDLATQPRPPGATELKGRPGVLRVRAGDYRVLNEVTDQQLVILLVDIGPRIGRRDRLEVMARTVTLTSTLTPEEGGFVARCLELDVTSEGDTVEEALAMLREAVELYLEDEPLPDHLGHPVVTSFDVTVPVA
jgi:mRNA interferase RelE/StbE